MFVCVVVVCVFFLFALSRRSFGFVFCVCMLWAVIHCVCFVCVFVDCYFVFFLSCFLLILFVLIVV